MKAKKYCEYCGKPLSENCGCRTGLEKMVSNLELQVTDMKTRILQYEYEELSKKLLEYETRQKIFVMTESARKALKPLAPKIREPLPHYNPDLFK